MSVVENFESINPLSFQKSMERFYAGIVPWISFLGIAVNHSSGCLVECL